jgi:hypothetical protein
MCVATLAQFGVIPGRSLQESLLLEMRRVAAALSILVLFLPLCRSPRTKDQFADVRGFRDAAASFRAGLPDGRARTRLADTS